MYGIFTYIWLIFMVNVGKYAIPYGFAWISPKRHNRWWRDWPPRFCIPKETRESDGNWAQSLRVEGNCLVESIHPGWILGWAKTGS